MATLNKEGLDQIARKAEVLGGGVQFADILTDKFFAGHSDFDTAAEFCEAAGLKGPEDAVGESFAEFVRLRTRFDTWNDLIAAAVAQHLVD